MPPIQSKTRIAGWIVSGLLAALLIGMSARMKLMGMEGMEAQLEKMGLTVDQMFKIGVVEALITVLFLIPRTSFVGAILLTGYLGGAVVTHLRMGESLVMPIAIGVLVWVALGLRRPEIFSLAVTSSLAPSDARPAS